MPEPEDTINNPDGTGDEVVDTQETAPATPDTNNPAGTEVADGEQDANTQEDGQDSANDSFLNPKTKKAIDEQIARNPDLKPNYDNWYKQMQGDYTRKRQADSKWIKELETKAATADRIQGDPELMKLIQGFKTGIVKLTGPEQKEAAGDILAEWLKGLDPEERMLVNRIRPGFEQLIENALAPLRTVTETTTEKTALAELSASPKFSEIDVPTYWDDVKEIKKKYPAISYEDALKFAIGSDWENVSSNLKKFGEEEAGKKKGAKDVPMKKAAFVAGGSGTGQKQAADETDDADLTAEQYAKKHGLKVAGE